MVDDKLCTTCRERKPRTAFYSSKQTRDGLCGRCRSCTLIYQAGYYARNRPAKQQRARELHLARHGLTPEGYASLLATQGGHCAICPALPTPGRRFDIDHDHKCCPGDYSCGECIRGLMCGKHNAMLGLSGDDAALLRTGADYLDAYDAKRLTGSVSSGMM